MKKLLKDQYFWYTAIIVIISLVFAYLPQITESLPEPLHTAPQTAFYVAGYRMLLPLAVVFAAWRYGVRIGSGLCLGLGAIILVGVFINSEFPNIFIDIADIVISLVLSRLVGRQGELKHKLEITAAELETNSLNLVKEIAERKRAEEQYRLIAENTADIIYKMSLNDWKFNYVSPSVKHTLGYTLDESYSLALTDLLTPESFQKQNTGFMSAVQNGQSSATLQLDLRHKDGRILPFEVHATMVRDEGGKPAEIVGVAREITDRRKMETQLVMQDRLASIGELTSGMAHDEAAGGQVFDP